MQTTTLKLPTAFGAWRIEDEAIYYQGQYAGRISVSVYGAELEINNIYLSERYQRRGFTTAYLQQLKELLTGQGMDAVTVYAHGAGASVWHKLGFEPVNTYDAADIIKQLTDVNISESKLEDALSASANPLNTLLEWTRAENALDVMPLFPWHGRLRLHTGC